MKTCKGCNTPKPLEEYAIRSRSKDGKQDTCRPCANEYGRQNYQDNKERYFAQAKKRDALLDELINSHKARPCVDCGESYPPYVMDFDHLTDKEFGISVMRRRRMAFDKIVAEIAKCEVVCANCHRIRTHGPEGRSPARYVV